MAWVEKLFNTNFLEYASYVIRERAIPHIDDGFKPVQRRIMHSLLEIDDGKLHKVANVVGHCMKYHPHGDASIFAALVLLANKDLFIEKQGNFGNIFTGDDASAPRYIECRALPFAKRVLHNPELTTWLPSYDGRNREPAVFPAKIPVLLIQGAEGIAVGMSTKILPHNFTEVLKAVRSRLRGKKTSLSPDFPTGGLIDVSAYDDGTGSVLVRAGIDTDDPKRLIIRELPFGSTTESLISSIENAARKGKIKIGSINDYTTDRVEIEIQLPRGVYAEDLLNALYAFTDCEQNISVNPLVIRDALPTVMTISEIIDHHADQLQNILRRELEHELSHLLDTLHARTLERIFIEERIYKVIEEMDSMEKIHRAVRKGFEPFVGNIGSTARGDNIARAITPADIDTLLNIPIRRISVYDIKRAQAEMERIQARINECRAHLKDIITYAESFLTSIISTRSSHFPRRTSLESFSKIEVRAAAIRNLTLRYDPRSGFVGTALSSGNVLFEVNEFDRILVIRKDGAYSVHTVSGKEFFGAGLRAVLPADKEHLFRVVHTIIYQNKEKQTYIKRCRIEKFIHKKTYHLVAEGCKIIAYTMREGGQAQLQYKPRPRLKITEEFFAIEDYPVKGSDARGLRLSAKEVMKTTIRAQKKA
ncbi:MAG: DNA topoisomerase IV subunit A [Salinispira sp.]